MSKSKTDIKKDEKPYGKAANETKQKNNNDLNPEKIIQEKAQTFLKTARLAVKSLELQKAVSNYLKVHFLLPNQIEVLNELGNTFSDMGDISSAIQYYQKSLILKSDASVENKINNLLIKKGLLLLEQDEMEDVLASFEVKATSSQEVNALENSSKDSSNQKGSEEIAANNDKVNSNPISEEKKEISPNDLNFRKSLLKAFGYLKVNFKQKALRELNICLNTGPKHVQPFLMKSKILWSLSDITEAIKLIWMAYDIDPNNSEVCEFIKIIEPLGEEHHEKAKRYLIQNEDLNCMNQINKGLEYNPHHTHLLMLRGNYLIKKKLFFENNQIDF